jgi:hypothetical protein
LDSQGAGLFGVKNPFAEQTPLVSWKAATLEIWDIARNKWRNAHAPSVDARMSAIQSKEEEERLVRAERQPTHQSI